MAKKKSNDWCVHIRHGDCLTRIPADQSDQDIGGAHDMDLAIIDPPYNIGYEYRAYIDKKKPQDYLLWCQEWLTAVYGTLAKHGSLWLFSGPEFVSELDILCKRTLGLYQRSHIIWGYGFGVANTKNFARAHTHLLYYTKHKTKFTFNADDPAVRVPSNRALVYGDKRANPKGKLPDNVWALTKEAMEAVLPPDGSLWYVSRICGTYRERQKVSSNQLPLPLVERIIRTSSNPGDFVFDPMLGSGTTAVAAGKLGRKFLGYDIDKECCRHAQRRVNQLFGQLSDDYAREHARPARVRRAAGA